MYNGRHKRRIDLYQDKLGPMHTVNLEKGQRSYATVAATKSIQKPSQPMNSI